MSEKFLLPCECGRTITVERRQAGTTARCACGKDREVPSIREINRLSRVEIDEPLKPIWGWRQSLVFLGLAIAIPCFVFTGYLYYRMPVLSETNVMAVANELSPMQSWVWWMQFRDGLPKQPSPDSIAVHKGIAELRMWINLSLIVGALGLAIAVAGLFVRTRPQPGRSAGIGGKKLSKA